MSFEPVTSSMSPLHFSCSATPSTDRPTTFTLRLSNSGLSDATRPSSVVHTGVKSFGCEKRTAQLSPFHSWKLMVPSVLSALKSGASSPRRMAMVSPPGSVVSMVSRETLARPRAKSRPGRSGFCGRRVTKATLTHQASARYS